MSGASPTRCRASTRGSLPACHRGAKARAGLFRVVVSRRAQVCLVLGALRRCWLAAVAVWGGVLGLVHVPAVYPSSHLRHVTSTAQHRPLAQHRCVAARGVPVELSKGMGGRAAAKEGRRTTTPRTSTGTTPQPSPRHQQRRRQQRLISGLRTPGSRCPAAWRLCSHSMSLVIVVVVCLVGARAPPCGTSARVRGLLARTILWCAVLSLELLEPHCTSRAPAGTPPLCRAPRPFCGSGKGWRRFSSLCTRSPETERGLALMGRP